MLITIRPPPLILTALNAAHGGKGWHFDLKSDIYAQAWIEVEYVPDLHAQGWNFSQNQTFKRSCLNLTTTELLTQILKTKLQHEYS